MEFVIYYLIACAVIFILMVCDIKYYEIRDILRHYDTINNHIKVIDDKLSKTDKDDFGELNRLMDERDYWLSLNKGKENYKWILRLKNNK